MIFKLPKPDSLFDYEAKIVVPIADVCSRERQVSVHRFAGGSGADGGASQDASDTAAEKP